MKNFPSKYEIGDIVKFKITEYLEPVDAVIISIGFTDKKVVHTIAIPRGDEFDDETVSNGKLLS